MWPFARRRLHEVPLDVLPSGPVAPRLGELLTWRGMDHLLQDVRTRYDFVIIDVPALLPVSDAAAVAARADGVILVVRYRRTTEQVAAAASALEAVSAPLVGTVLTMTPARQARRRRLRAYPERPASLLPLLSPAKSEAPQNRHPAEGHPRPRRTVPAPTRPWGRERGGRRQRQRGPGQSTGEPVTGEQPTIDRTGEHRPSPTRGARRSRGSRPMGFVQMVPARRRAARTGPYSRRPATQPGAGAEIAVADPRDTA
jgi:non-specific protein-tyrosine kinase